MRFTRALLTTALSVGLLAALPATVAQASQDSPKKGHAHAHAVVLALNPYHAGTPEWWKFEADRHLPPVASDHFMTGAHHSHHRG